MGRIYIGQRGRRGIEPIRRWDDGAGSVYLGALDGADAGVDPGPPRPRRPVFLENPIDLADEETQRRGGILLRIRPELTSNVATVTNRSLDLAQGLLSTVQWALVAALVVAILAAGVAVWMGTSRKSKRD